MTIASSVSREMYDLISELTLRLLAGTHAAHATLRAQFAVASVTEVTLTGHGFYAHFHVPAEATRVDQRRIIGGNLPMEVEGLEHGAGCLLCVTDGSLDFLEAYTYDEAWPEHPVVLSFGKSSPLEITSAS